MEEMEKLVWQRVTAGPGEQGRMDLRPLMLAAAENLAVYRATEGPNKHLLRPLMEGEQGNLRTLRGICRMCTSDPGRLQPCHPGKPGQKALIGCYHRSRLLLAEYTARSAEPEFGSIFRCLAQRQEGLCALLAEVIGSWEGR